MDLSGTHQGLEVNSRFCYVTAFEDYPHLRHIVNLIDGEPLNKYQRAFFRTCFVGNWSNYNFRAFILICPFPERTAKRGDAQPENLARERAGVDSLRRLLRLLFLKGKGRAAVWRGDSYATLYGPGNIFSPTKNLAF